MSGAPIIFVALITSPLTRFQIKLCCNVPTATLQYVSEVNYLWICLIQNIRLWSDPVQLVLGAFIVLSVSVPSLLPCRQSLSQSNGHLKCNGLSVLELPTSLRANTVEYNTNTITKKRLTDLFLKWF